MDNERRSTKAACFGGRVGAHHGASFHDERAGEAKSRASVGSQLQEVMSKLEALGVYDLKGLAVGLSVLNSEAGTT